MHWILQEHRSSDRGWDDLVSTLQRFGISHSIHKVVPFVGDLLPAPQLDTKNVICFGSYSMRRQAILHGWTPGVFDLEPQDFKQQLKHWGHHMLNADSRVSALKDAVFPQAHEFAFVRPTTDSKSFAGQVFSREEFENWHHQVMKLDLNDDDYHTVDPATEVQVNQAISIWSEYRYWAVKGRIATSSLYKWCGRTCFGGRVDETVDAYVRDRIKEWEPHEAFVIDVCETSGGVKIVEINTMNAAGFYAANIQKLVVALEEAF